MEETEAPLQEYRPAMPSHSALSAASIAVALVAIVLPHAQSVSAFQFSISTGTCSQSALPSRISCAPPAASVRSITSLRAEGNKYGRGSEIWPPTNEEPVELADSFPDGVVPAFVADFIEGATPMKMEASTTTSSAGGGQGEMFVQKRRGRKRKMIRGAVGRVLRRAATSEQRTATGDRSARGGSEAFWDAPVDRLPAVLAAALLILGGVRPTDLLAVAGLSAYLVVLGLVASSPREIKAYQGPWAYNNSAPIGISQATFPSLPPQGHVPSLVSNPLGVALTNSVAYRTWLRLGAVLGLLLPLGAVAWYRSGPEKDLVAAIAVSRPVFLLCCQAISEAASRRLLVS